VCDRRGLESLRRPLVAGIALALLASLAIPAHAAGGKVSSKSRGDATKAAFGDMPKGPLQFVISIRRQHVTLYSNGQRVAQSPVSTGTPGHATPTGVFSIIEKDRWHHSNLYDNAPMYFMQRLTWSGVAMHEGSLPGYAASHGCIRMPHDFAARLWTLTRLGARVVIVHDDVVPQDFDDPHLFMHQDKPPEAPTMALSFNSLRPSLTDFGGAPTQPIKLIAAEPAPVVSTPTVEAPKHSGQVAVFVSRKQKKIYVRQGFVPLFEMPIEIADPDQPLGTHLFTALEFQPDGRHMRWNAVTLPSGQPSALDRSGKKTKPGPVKPGPTAAEALARIQFPLEARDRISEALIPGSSLIISDLGLGTETGQHTEFIVVTR
jgi:L,D-transpeptidase catalytic domain